MTGITYSNKSLTNVASGTCHAVTFKPDGSKVFFGSGNGVYQWNLSTNWDISTAVAQTTANGNNNDYLTLGSNLSSSGPTGLAFSSDGSKIFIAASMNYNQYVAQADLSSPWDTANSTQLILGARDSTNKRSYLGKNSSNVSVLGNESGFLTGGSISVEANFVLFGVHDVGKRLISTNGTVVSNTSGAAPNNTNQGYMIGALNNAGTASSLLNGKIAEVIVYASDQSSKRTDLETNINSHYSIF